MAPRVECTYNRSDISFELVDNYGDRGTSIEWLLRQAYEQIRDELTDDTRKIIVYTDDQPVRDPGGINISDTRDHPVFPCWSHHHWKSAFIDDYTETCNKCLENGLKPPSIDKLFWAGSPTHPNRLTLGYLGLAWPNLIHSILMSFFNDSVSRYVPIPDQTNYSFLIDVEGKGYSARIKILAFCRRPLFIQDRPNWDYASRMLVPWEHYIPVKRDLTDLMEKYMWAREHREEAQAIADRCTKFAQENFTTSKIVNDISVMLKKCPPVV